MLEEALGSLHHIMEVVFVDECLDAHCTLLAHVSLCVGIKALINKDHFHNGRPAQQ